MNNSGECNPPFLRDETENCTLTVYEFYEPFTYYLKQVSTILDFLLLLGLIAILFSFLRSNKKQWYKKRRISITADDEKKKFFFKYNLLIILCLLTGTIFHLHLAYNNFMYARDFRSNLSKRNSLCLIYMSIFFHGGIFLRLPVLKELIGLSKLSSRYQSIQSGAIFTAFITSLPYFFLMPYLVYFEKLSVSNFIIICYSHGLINSLLLGIVLYCTTNFVVEGIQTLTEQHIKEKKNRKEINKLYTFKVKLKLCRAALTFHIVVLLMMSLPNLLSIDLYYRVQKDVFRLI
eukprot:snap_masked-scaffold_28-processed-gene-1.14-mRNA-1 protein AED:1.00 eAED:1.00 QI:0/0/0/0/1/1/2/0/289